MDLQAKMKTKRVKKAVKIGIIMLVGFLVFDAIGYFSTELQKTKYNILADGEGSITVISPDGNERLIFYEWSSLPHGGVDVVYRRKGDLIEHYLGTIHYYEPQISVKDGRFEIAWGQDEVTVTVFRGAPWEEKEDPSTWTVKTYQGLHEPEAALRRNLCNLGICVGVIAVGMIGGVVWRRRKTREINHGSES